MFSISEYRISVHGSDSSQGFQQRATIYLYSDPSTLVGQVYFFDNRTQLASDHIGSGGWVVMHLHMRLLRPTIDLLRNESPPTLHEPDANGRARLDWGPEGVSEGEA